jgi:O-antigen/teichoic acid export membrane protein
VSSRLARGTAAGAYGQIIQILTQLVAIPVFTHAWGLEVYGAWLILFTIPQLLAMSDLGLTAAGGNAMIAAIARSDVEEAGGIYGTLRSATIGLALAGIGLGGLVLWLAPLASLGPVDDYTGGHAALIGAALLGYSSLGIVNMVSLAAFRAADAYALGNFLFHTMLAIEAAIALAAAALGHSPLVVATAYFGARAAGTAAMVLVLRRRAAWVRHSPLLPQPKILRVLLAPSLAALVLPAANAILVQGSILAIGSAAGAAAVPAFTATRTLSRCALQFVIAFNLASMPQFTVANTRGDVGRRDRLVGLNLLISAGVLLPVAALLIVIGRPFVEWWTGGVVSPSATLVILLVAAMLLNGLWMPLANLILATNDHATYSYAFLAVTVATVAGGYIFALSDGATGMAAAIVMGEILMVGWVVRLVLHLGVLRPAALASLAKGQIGRIGRFGRRRPG